MATGTQDLEMPRAGTIKFARSVLARAERGEKDAILEMFKRFVSEGEDVSAAEYLGVQGMWGIGTRSFGCLTSRRVASLRVGAFGQIVYQDGFLEFLNSVYVYQPSRLGLYIWGLLLVVLAIPTFGLALLLFPLMVRTYYRFNKCGLVFVIREGVSVYMFTNRKLLERANAMYRATVQLREKRLKEPFPAATRLAV